MMNNNNIQAPVTPMNNRVYAVAMVRAIMNNFNADFDGNPRVTPSGIYFASDKAFKFCFRMLSYNEDDLVLALRRMKEVDSKQKAANKAKGKGKKANAEAEAAAVAALEAALTEDAEGADEQEKNGVIPKNLAEGYEEMFGKAVTSSEDREILHNLFSCSDVINFGAAFPIKGHNHSITGAVQINNGLNKYELTQDIKLEVLSPYGVQEKEKTTMGSRKVVDEAHYAYNITINPENYKDFKKFLGDFEGYTVDDYRKFKSRANRCVTAFNSCTRIGCENEFSLFVEVKEGSMLHLPALTTLIRFVKNEGGKDIFDLTELALLDEFVDEIERVEIYHNNFDTEVKTCFTALKDKVVVKSIFGKIE